MRRFMYGLAGLGLLLALGAQAQEEKVTVDTLPKAVLAAVKAKFPGAKLTGAGKELEEGKVVYEVSLTYKGSKYDVTLTPEGKVVSVEKEIAFKDLPKAVAAAFAKKYPKATVKKTEEITKDGKVTYEVLLVTAEKKTFEAVFDPKGKLLNEEAKDPKKEEKEEKKGDKTEGKKG